MRRPDGVTNLPGSIEAHFLLSLLSFVKDGSLDKREIEWMDIV